MKKLLILNNSPDILRYIWLQLDENEHNNFNNANYQESSRIPKYPNVDFIEQKLNNNVDNGKGVKIKSLTDMLKQ